MYRSVFGLVGWFSYSLVIHPPALNIQLSCPSLPSSSFQHPTHEKYPPRNDGFARGAKNIKVRISMYLDLSQGFRSGINGSPTFVPDLSFGPSNVLTNICYWSGISSFFRVCWTSKPVRVQSIFGPWIPYLVYRLTLIFCVFEIQIFFSL